jgi:nucleoside-diphosphate-sugar epimerase
MRRVLIAGCGYVGRATAELFHAEGWEVTGWTASEKSADALSSALPFPVRAVDLVDGVAVKSAGAGDHFDAVIHCASSRGGEAEAYRRIYLSGVQNLAAAFPQALLLFTSSTSVYGQADGEWVIEESPAEPSHEKGKILREGEEVVLARGGIIARLAGIYGPGRSALLQKFLAGEAAIDPREDRFINQVHRDDIARALLLLVQKHFAGELSGSRIFNVSDNHPQKRSECLQWLAAELRRDLATNGEAPQRRKRGDSNKRVSSEKLLRLGWQPRYPTFQSAVKDSLLPAAG